MSRLRAALAAALLLLSGCRGAEAETVRPALWEVTGPQGEKGWLFGTIHALPETVDWRTPAMDKALAGSGELVLEIADSRGVPAVFARLSRARGLPRLTDRVPPALRPALRRVLAEHNLSDSQFGDLDTWAAAMMISQAAQGAATAEHGLEAALREAMAGKPIGELEGGATQLAVFDRLPEQDQRDLLAGVIGEAASPPGERDPLYDAWAKGDLAALERENHTGFLADPELNEALLAGRNRAWVPMIAAILRAGRHPLVAVGAAHVAGDAGLPALLADEGFRVTRVQ